MDRRRGRIDHRAPRQRDEVGRHLQTPARPQRHQLSSSFPELPRAPLGMGRGEEEQARQTLRKVSLRSQSPAPPILANLPHCRFKKDMWEKISKEMALPWRAAEAMHWQIGEVEMAQRANVPVFHLAGGPPPTSAPGAAALPDNRSSTSPGSVSSGHVYSHAQHTHNHSLPQQVSHSNPHPQPQPHHQPHPHQRPTQMPTSM